MSTAPSSYKHVMVDIETMGKAPHGAILSIGAVPFSIHEKECKVAPSEMWFHERCSLEANDLDGRVIDPDTIEWWLAQSDEAREALLQQPRFETVGGLCKAFSWWVAWQPGLRAETIWAKPPQFDLTILRDAFSNSGVDWPFRHNAERDLRALLAVGRDMGMSGQQMQMRGTAHNAVEDAAHQAELACAVYRHLYGTQAAVSRLTGERQALLGTIKSQSKEIRGWVERVRDLKTKWGEGWTKDDLIKKLLEWPLPDDIEGTMNVEVDPSTFQSEG